MQTGLLFLGRLICNACELVLPERARLGVSESGTGGALSVGGVRVCARLCRLPLEAVLPVQSKCQSVLQIIIPRGGYARCKVQALPW